MNKPKTLVNLPPGFFATPALEPLWARLDGLADVRRASCNTVPEILPLLADREAVIMWSWPKLGPAEFARAPHLKFCGHLNVYGSMAKAALDRGIAVSEAGRAWSPAVAEMALALILSGLRKLGSYHHAFRTGSEAWIADFPADIDPGERQLTGRAVGIVGFGGIGRRLAELLAPFQPELRIYDPYVAADVARQLGGQPVALDELLRQSEVVVLAAANTAETKNLIGAGQLELLRPDALLVNVCRASVVDTGALLTRLAKGGFTYLTDVYDREPLPGDSPLRAMPNVFGTPHRAGAPMESIIRILTWLIDDLAAHLDNRPRQHAITAALAARLPEDN